MVIYQKAPQAPRNAIPTRLAMFCNDWNHPEVSSSGPMGNRERRREIKVWKERKKANRWRRRKRHLRRKFLPLWRLNRHVSLSKASVGCAGGVASTHLGEPKA